MLDRFFQYLARLDLANAIIPGLIVLFIGHKVTEHQPAIRRFVYHAVACLFVLLLGGQLYFQWPVEGEALTGILFRSLLLAGILLGCGWIAAPAIAGLYDYTLGALFRGIKRTLPVFIVTLLRWFTWPVRFPFNLWLRRNQTAEQERLRREREEHAKKQTSEQKRRQDARARCEVLFVTHSFEIRERFTREMFDAFVVRHLGDDKPPEYVEKLAGELCDIIQKHLEKTDGRAKKSLAELAQWFLKEKQQIDTTALSDEDKQMLLAQLEERYVKLQEKYLRSVHP